MPNERILIVEDEVGMVARAVEIGLKGAGYRITGIATTERQAVKRALRDLPDVVLMDIMLDDTKGGTDRLAGLRAARKISLMTGAEVVFVTGIGDDPDVRAEAKKTPHFHWVYKPLKMPLLLAEIERALERAKRRRVIAASFIRMKSVQCKFDAFFSHNSKDKAAVEKIALGLLQVGIRPWLDTWNLIPGTRITDALEEVIKKSRCAVLFFGPADVGKWHIVEIRAVLEEWANGKARMIPVILPGVGNVPKISSFVRQSLWVDMRNWESKGSDAFYRLVCGILDVPPGPPPFPKVTVRDVIRWQRIKF